MSNAIAMSSEYELWFNIGYIGFFKHHELWLKDRVLMKKRLIVDDMFRDYMYAVNEKWYNKLILLFINSFNKRLYK